MEADAEEVVARVKLRGAETAGVAVARGLGAAVGAGKDGAWEEMTAEAEDSGGLVGMGVGTEELSGGGAEKVAVGGTEGGIREMLAGGRED